MYLKQDGEMAKLSKGYSLMVKYINLDIHPRIIINHLNLQAQKSHNRFNNVLFINLIRFDRR